MGLAHGIAGPLALLSLCWTRGLRVPGHDTAVRRIARWLMSWSRGARAGATALRESPAPSTSPESRWARTRGCTPRRRR
ncbi:MULTISPECIES: lanthionine synthetase LanC family protein [Streptomyces]|uniref:lanthionine synthetase LanC family protein n=1 Tax=Streptomyces lycopersici TaxID=2974589 RepID=UPI003523B400